MLKFRFRRKPAVVAPLHEQAARMLDTGIERMARRIAWLEGQIALHQAELDKTLDIHERYVGAQRRPLPAPVFKEPDAEPADFEPRPFVRQNGIAIDEDGTYRMTRTEEAGERSIGDLAKSVVDGVAEAMASPLLRSEPTHYNPLAVAGMTLAGQRS